MESADAADARAPRPAQRAVVVFPPLPPWIAVGASGLVPPEVTWPCCVEWPISVLVSPTRAPRGLRALCSQPQENHADHACLEQVGHGAIHKVVLSHVAGRADPHSTRPFSLERTGGSSRRYS